MSFSDPPQAFDSDRNPYQAPAPATDPGAYAQYYRPDPLVGKVRALQVCCMTLGILQILCSLLAAAVTALVVAILILGEDEEAGVIILLAAVMGISGTVNLALGVATCFRITWVVWITMALCFLSALANLASFNVCGLVFMLFFLGLSVGIQVLAYQIRAAGASPRAKIVGGQVVS